MRCGQNVNDLNINIKQNVQNNKLIQTFIKYEIYFN